MLLGSIFTLAWPALLEQALQTVVQYADSAMVGQLGAQSTAAVGITTPVSWLVNAPMFAMGIGFLACISRALGAKDEKTARTAAGQTIFAVLILGIGIGLLTVGLSPFIPGWLNAAPEIQATASRYFAIVCLPMIFRAASALFSSALRAAGNTRTPMLVNAAMNAINLVLNFFLIFDSCTLTLFGRELLIPRAGLGVEGAAIASAISYVFSGLMMFRALWRSPLLTPKGMRLRWNKEVMGQCARIGVPVVFTRIGVCLGHVVFLSQVSSLGTTALAAHSLALTTEEAVYLPGYGMQAAASTLAGNAVGGAQRAKADARFHADLDFSGAADGADRRDTLPLPKFDAFDLYAGSAGHRHGRDGLADHCGDGTHLCLWHYLGGRIQRRWRHQGSVHHFDVHDLVRPHSADRHLCSRAAPRSHRGLVLHGAGQRDPRPPPRSPLLPRQLEKRIILRVMRGRGPF